MLARSAACGRRSLVRRLTGRLIRLRGSAPLLRTPPAARAFSPLLASWASGPRFCLPRSVLRPWRLAAARARPRPLLWAVFGPRLCSLLACAPSPRRIASRARLARFPPCSALASAGRLPGPGLGVAPAGGSAVRPPVGLCGRCWLLPRLVFCPPPPRCRRVAGSASVAEFCAAPAPRRARCRAPRCGQKVISWTAPTGPG